MPRCTRAGGRSGRAAHGVAGPTERAGGRLDPDGAGALTAPVNSYGYDYHGNLTSITNPLSKVTSFEYVVECMFEPSHVAPTLSSGHRATAFS